MVCTRAVMQWGRMWGVSLCRSLNLSSFKLMFSAYNTNTLRTISGQTECLNIQIIWFLARRISLELDSISYLIVPHAPAFLHSFLLLVTVVKGIRPKCPDGRRKTNHLSSNCFCFPCFLSPLSVFFFRFLRTWRICNCSTALYCIWWEIWWT